jgi:FtsZ-binding cell division protein ZapB
MSKYIPANQLGVFHHMRTLLEETKKTVTPLRDQLQLAVTELREEKDRLSREQAAQADERQPKPACTGRTQEVGPNGPRRDRESPHSPSSKPEPKD